MKSFKKLNKKVKNLFRPTKRKSENQSTEPKESKKAKTADNKQKGNEQPPIDIYETTDDSIRIQVESSESKSNQINDSINNDLIEKIEKNKKLNDSIKKESEQKDKLIQQQLSNKDNKVRELESELENTKSELGNTKSELGNTKSELGNTKSELERTKNELDQLRKKSEIGSKDKQIQNKSSELQQNKLSEQDRNSELESELERTKNELVQSSKKSEIELKDKQIQQLTNKLSEIQGRNYELENEIEKIKNEFDQLLKKSAEQKDKHIQPLTDKISEIQERNSELESEIERARNELERTKNELVQLREELEDKNRILNENHINNLEQHTTNQYQDSSIIDSLQQKLNEKEEDLRRLEEKNTELRKEASKYQSALGNATNIRLGDEDSVKFRDDILELQKTLETFVTNLKPNMDVEVEKVKILAQQYGCKTPISQKNKPFIKALLQRKVLDDIINFFDESRSKNGDAKLETDIELKAQDLLSLINEFSASRDGTDEIVKVAAIKVRQQVYGILGNRGFANVTGPNGNHAHDFITYVGSKLNDMINQYRVIKDPNKKLEAESKAPKLIQDVYKFFYLLNVQEPKVEYKFCESGTKVDPNIMKGRWDDDEVPHLLVDICSFPMVGRDLDKPDWKIYTQAKVFTRNETG